MGRKTKKLVSRDLFYIVTNGKESEKNYFELLKSYKSQYNVKIEFQNNDPKQLVEYCAKLIPTANQVWCVFDIDDFHEEGKIEPALTLAKNEGVKIAFSNRSFEVWLIAHYKKCENYMDKQVLERELNAILNECKKGLSYSKSSREILQKYFLPNYKKGIENSKIVHQKCILKNTNCSGLLSHKVWEWNPCSTVYLLLEALKLQK